MKLNAAGKKVTSVDIPYGISPVFLSVDPRTQFGEIDGTTATDARRKLSRTNRHHG